jgi:hypothetical protein
VTPPLSDRGTMTSMADITFGGMTVNERLYAAGCSIHSTLPSSDETRPRCSGFSKASNYHHSRPRQARMHCLPIQFASASPAAVDETFLGLNATRSCSSGYPVRVGPA